MKRVVITGLGVVSPLGNDVTAMWERLLNGDNAVDTLTKIDISQYPAKVGAEVKEWNIDHLVEPKEARKMDSFIQYSILAADAAHRDSGLDVKAIADEVGIWIGSGIGGVETIDKQASILHERGPRRISPFFIPMMIPNMASGQVSIYLGRKDQATVRSQLVPLGRTQSGKRSKSFNVAMRLRCSQAEPRRRSHRSRSQDSVPTKRYRRIRTRTRHAVRSTRTVTGSSWVKARACSFSRNTSMRKRVAPKCMRKSSGTA